jgi:hypothetical protein
MAEQEPSALERRPSSAEYDKEFVVSGHRSLGRDPSNLPARHSDGAEAPGMPAPSTAQVRDRACAVDSPL